MSASKAASFVIAATLFSTSAAFAQGAATGGLHRSLFPNNVDCGDFEKIGRRVWILRDKTTIDLGNWDGSFAINGNIKPRVFMRKGVDLYDVLASKCEAHAF